MNDARQSPMTWVAAVTIAVGGALLGGCGGCGIEQSPGQLMRGEADRQGLERLEEEGRDRVRSGSQRLSFELVEAVRDETEGDFAISPQAFLMGVGQLIPAVEGDTRQSIAEMWGVEEEELEMVMAVLNQQGVHLEGQSGSGLRLDHRNDVWVDSRLEPSQAYLDLLMRYSGRGIHGVDGETAIDDWIQRVMGDRSIELVGEWEEGSVALTQAVKVGGMWQYAFEEEASGGGPMESADDAQVRPMMEGRESYRFYRDAQTQAVAFGYQGTNTSLIAMKPRSSSASFEEWEEGLDSARFLEVVDGLSRLEEGEVGLPTFEVSHRWDLRSALGEMAPEMTGDEVDLSGIGSPAPRRLGVVGHHAALEVGSRGGRQSAEHVEEARSRGQGIRFDRPFYVVVYDQGAEAVLLVGRVMEGLEAEHLE